MTKKILLCSITIGFALVATSCKKEIEDFPGAIEDGKVEGTLSSALVEFGVDSVYLFMDYDSEYNVLNTSAPVKDGKFSLTLPTPTTNDIFLMFDPDAEDVAGMTIKPRNIMFTSFSLWIEGPDELLNIGLVTVDADIMFLYSNTDAVIRGTRHCKGNDIDSSADDYVENYDMNLKAGWNSVFCKGGTLFGEISYTSDRIPKGALWVGDIE